MGIRQLGQPPWPSSGRLGKDQPEIETARGRRFPPALVTAAAAAVLASMMVGQAAAAPTDVPIDPDVPTGFFQIVFAGGMVGAVIMLILLALSVTAAYLVIDHLLTVRRRDLMPEGLSDEVRQALGNGQVDQARQACVARPSFLSFVLLHGIDELQFGWTSVEKSIEDALAEQSARLLRKIEYLSVIGNIAPMIGLLGTVIGMIFAFQQVATTQGTAGAPQLAQGIYQALVTTVGGLIVAIPAIGAFAIFRNRIDQFVAEAAYLAQHVFAPLRRRRKAT